MGDVKQTNNKILGCEGRQMVKKILSRCVVCKKLETMECDESGGSTGIPNQGSCTLVKSRD